DRLYFALSEEGVIPAGQTEILLPASCMETGEIGNDYMAGEISTIVDPIPYVSKMTNITKTEGGSEREEDEHYRERIHEAPEKFSTAGSYGAYRYWAMTASSLIADVQPYGPEESPGTVELYVLLENGGIPGEEMLSKVMDAVSADDNGVRPFTDHVVAMPPDIVSYGLSMEYFILSGADATATEKAVEAAVDDYVLWQKEKLGRDINPDELTHRLKSISGVKRVNILSPEFTALDERQVAVANGIRLTMMGREDE
ncbi:MAG: baseplate J/gp47 family protein, partial [Selenomonadaceae bacterium]|nr:baseplate J/gp47 family protein [Selenomonadaceae bacterium]